MIGVRSAPQLETDFLSQFTAEEISAFLSKLNDGDGSGVGKLLSHFGGTNHHYERRNDYFGSHGKFQLADGLCSVDQDGEKQIIWFGSNETDYWVDVKFEETTDSQVNTENNLPSRNQFSKLFNFASLLSGNPSLDTILANPSVNMHGECQVNYPDGRSEVISFGSDKTGYSAAVKRRKPLKMN